MIKSMNLTAPRLHEVLEGPVIIDTKAVDQALLPPPPRQLVHADKLVPVDLTAKLSNPPLTSNSLEGPERILQAMCITLHYGH